MESEIFVAALGFAGVILTQVMTSLRKESLLANKLEGIKTEFNIKIDNLSTSVQKHNNVIERTYELEKQVSILMDRSE